MGEGKVALQNPKMTYIVKVLCLFVLLSPLRLERKPKDLDLLTLVSSKTVLANVVLKDSNVVDISIVPKDKYAEISTANQFGSPMTMTSSGDQPEKNNNSTFQKK